MNDQIPKMEKSLVKEIKDALDSDLFGQNVIMALKSASPRHPRIDLGSCRISKEGLLLVSNLIYVPEILRTKIISSSHDPPAAGHSGRKKTFELISRDFWWPKVRSTIEQYIRNCDTCARIKPVRHAPFGYLKPLEITQKRWQSISLDFVTGLPISSGYNMLLVVVDRLTKIAHFIPTITGCSAHKLAILLRDHIFRLHGLPETIISDRDPVFTLTLAQEMASCLSIKSCFSSAFHPQTDGQTERINAILEQYLRGYCNYQQDNWVDYLSMAEFSYNNSIFSSTQVSPFFANSGFNPRYQIISRQHFQPKSVEIKQFQQHLQRLESFIKTEIRYSQDIAADYVNSNRLPPPVYRIGDKVWLLRRNISTTRPSVKKYTKYL